MPAPQRRTTDIHNRRLDKIIEAAQAMCSDEPYPIPVADFIEQYYKNVSVEDLRDRSLEDLAGAAIAHLQFAMSRKPGVPKYRVFNPDIGWTSPHSILQMVNDNMPFLVDSSCMALNRRGLVIRLTVHPIFNTVRDDQYRIVGFQNEADENSTQESWIQVEFSKETDEMVLQELETHIGQVLDDVRAACNDWAAMKQESADLRDSLASKKLPLNPDDLREGLELLKWMEDDHFTYLGCREYKLLEENDEDTLAGIPHSGLGILRGGPILTQLSNSNVLPKDIRKQVRSKELLIVTKANSPATVHRPSYLDYVGVKVFDDDGKVIGERRFLGLFTSVAYSRSPRDIPLLRHKINQVMERSDLQQNSHARKALMHILETYPRDELFQSSVDDLFRTAHGIFSLQERQRIKLFVRKDPFRRFFSCIVYVPREQYTTRVRRAIQKILMEAFNGDSVESSPLLSESVLARLHVIVRTNTPTANTYNIKSIENRITDAVRTWQDCLLEILVERFGEKEGREYFQEYGEVFPAAYEEDITPREATFDIERLAALGHTPSSLRMSLYRPPNFSPNHLRFKLFRREKTIPISDALPMLENMGLTVISERPYHVDLLDGSLVWIQDFEMEYSAGNTIDPAAVNEIFQQAFARTWLGDIENDGFNRLVLGASLTFRQTALVKAYCKYLLQTGMPFSQNYIERAINNNLGIARLLVELFETRFDPNLNKNKRRRNLLGIVNQLATELESVVSQDDDRILRGFRDMILATLRTNYFQRTVDDDVKDYVSFKIDPSKAPDLPLPLPMFEIFVYSPRVEGVHLRGGTVARGGLRWSDRREDFRTEVLGLMKAQMVKNTVIVPVGAKGGFVVKRPPPGNDRSALMEEVISCYKAFINGLLDVTDNVVDGEVITPDGVIREDQEDPYLVVAADKGTATFSDIANQVSAEHDFWLGDAFASGGSAGYDHKGMGITARGAWESVKRHFRELGIDTQTEEFTVAGIGDMSGDVFGNGMLLSKQTKLVAAFNHMHIFLDPDPDPAASYEERKRLFELPRSSWEDYDPSVISQDGGIFSRKEKTIPLTGTLKTLLDVNDDQLTPQELIRAILKMEVDLLWNGGIGTYVKAKSESDVDVGDRSNDSVRINGEELRCKVVGEGGNLGFTQLSRVEFAQRGGRINTDFIDNSAGVDTSDREVNIKILLGLAREESDLDLQQRDKLLSEMTDEVASLVLRNNYLQSQAISLMEIRAAERINEHHHFLHALEKTGGLNRSLEFLPTEEEFRTRKQNDSGLTRPELAVILSYSKINLYNALLASNVPEDPYLSKELTRYFPDPLQEPYENLMVKHPLRREIIANAINNSLINRMGPTFPERIREDTGADAAGVARAYTSAREIFQMHGIWAAIEKLDNDVQANAQYAMMTETIQLLKHATRWVLGPLAPSLSIAELVNEFQGGVAKLFDHLPELLADEELKRFKEAAELYSSIGTGDDLSRRVASLQFMRPALDIVQAANRSKQDVLHVGAVYHEVGAALTVNWLRDQIESLHVEGHWQASARGTLRENLYDLQQRIASAVIKRNGSAEPKIAVDKWVEKERTQVDRAKQVLNDMQTASLMDFPTLSVAVQEIRKLAY